MAYDDMKRGFAQIDCQPAPGNPLGVRHSEVAEQLDLLQYSINRLNDEAGNLLDRLQPVMRPDYPIACGPEETDCSTELSRRLKELRLRVDGTCDQMANARDRLEL